MEQILSPAQVDRGAFNLDSSQVDLARTTPGQRNRVNQSVYEVWLTRNLGQDGYLYFTPSVSIRDLGKVENIIYQFSRTLETILETCLPFSHPKDCD
ncbi:Hypothetical protein NTJ_04649 [Nesidiocoris tenuis]|uniref:Uncharacterized protein n=1 Tax=Nesidiocoris tenuis TaxID=355587 RepID=A0ABN7AHV2_9HEMI|nr:Hypothetical protein NTJ_04649 [Nesidiocoris tenuis]